MFNDITQVLHDASAGGDMASEDLLPLVYDELRRLASADMSREGSGHTLQPTALVHEAWIQLAVNDASRRWNDRAHFFRTAALVMRRILVDRARRKSTLKRGGGSQRIDISDIELAEATPDDCILLVNEVLGRLEKKDPETSQIITMKYFGCLSNQEVAEALGISERSVRRRWIYAKANLFKMIGEEL